MTPLGTVYCQHTHTISRFQGGGEGGGMDRHFVYGCFHCLFFFFFSGGGNEFLNIGPQNWLPLCSVLAKSNGVHYCASPGCAFGRRTFGNSLCQYQSLLAGRLHVQ